MKRFLFLVFVIGLNSIHAQTPHACSKSKIESLQRSRTLQAQWHAAAAGGLHHEKKHDTRFVHLNLNLERNTKYISGNVKTVARVNAASMDTFMVFLHSNFTIDSVRFNSQFVIPVIQDSAIKVAAPQVLSNGTQFTVTIFYKGTAPTGGAAIGSGYSLGTSPSWGNQVTWSLSESFVAYHWWPCKQDLTDKIDSSWVFVTTDSTNRVGSNGILKNIVTVGSKKRYEWKSQYPIDYYLISVATAKYKEYNLYSKPQYLINDSILIQNYIYDGAINNTNWINNQKVQLNKMPQVLRFLSEKYGMYPFYKEKYGHCMAPLGGGMEHQTMTTLGFFDYYINAHELGHQWWGDQVTCKTWQDIWINEGFASYTEHLVAQYLDPTNFAANLNSAHNAVMNLPGGSIFFTGNDTMNTPRIFDSRLTYDKGGAIIHTLRFITANDSLWFKTLRDFQNNFKHSTASANDFKLFYQQQTGINVTPFFNEWYYGEGYPTYAVKYNYNLSQGFFQISQTSSMPGITPLFTNPLELKISRSGKADTLVRFTMLAAVQNFTLALTGSITAVTVDPNNWIINKALASVRDLSLGATDITSVYDNDIKIALTPNPAHSDIQISNLNTDHYTLVVTDLKGITVFTTPIINSKHIKLPNLANGIYNVCVIDDHNKVVLSQRLIRE
jgi:aminopeptidase N